MSRWGGRPARAAASRRGEGLRRSRGLVERREACGCIAEASEAVRFAASCPKKAARRGICQPYLLIKETDLSQTSVPWCEDCHPGAALPS